MSISNALLVGDWDTAARALNDTSALKIDPDALHLAVCLSNIPLDLISNMIAKGYDVNATSLEDGASPLLCACASQKNKSNLPLFSLLLKAGADVNHRDFSRVSPVLALTEAKGSADVLRLLIKHGADVNLADVNDVTPLFAAVEHRCSLEIVQILIDAGADLHRCEKHGYSPLNIAQMSKASPDLLNLLSGKKEIEGLILNFVT